MKIKSHKKQIIKIVLCIISIFLTFQSSFACTCPLGNIPPCQAFEKADVVFIGTLKRMSDMNVSQERTPISIGEFSVSRISKGNIPQEIKVRIPVGDCGFLIKPQETYFIYAKKNDVENILEIDRCGRSNQIANAKADVEYIDSLNSQISFQSIVGEIKGLEKEELERISISVKNAGKTLNYQLDKNGYFKIKTKKEGSFNIIIKFPIAVEIIQLANNSTINEETVNSRTIVSYNVVLSSKKCDYRLLSVKKLGGI